jgi:excisionase family DNA binding protein
MCYGVPDEEGADMEQMLTVDQVAERLQVNEYTVRRWLRAGELEGVPFGGRTGWRVKEKDLQAFLNRRRDQGETGKAAA